MCILALSVFVGIQLSAPMAESMLAYGFWPKIPFVDPLFGVSCMCECLYNPQTVYLPHGGFNTPCTLMNLMGLKYSGSDYSRLPYWNN